MQIVYHLGAHCTDEDRLLRCLLRNRAMLANQGVVVPGPARYRKLLRDTAVQLKGARASVETQALVLEQIMDEDTADRLILSWDSFLSFPQWVLSPGLYPLAGERIRAFAQIFPDIDADFYMAIRNPATFLPALFEKQKVKSYEDFLNGIDPMFLHWSDVVAQIRAENPDISLTIWCDEDTPLIWPEVLGAVSGLGPDAAFDGADELLAQIMAPEGLNRLNDYLARNPPLNGTHRKRVVAAFLDKFVLTDKIEVEVALPGWTSDLIADLTAAYDADVARIAQMDGIRLIQP
jgi:hypothetical protein